MRRDVHNSKIPGGGCGQIDEKIDRKKVKYFVILFNEIKEKLESYEKARTAVKLSHDQMSKMKNKDILCRPAAKRIVAAHNRIIKKLAT